MDICINNRQTNPRCSRDFINVFNPSRWSKNCLILVRMVTLKYRLFPLIFLFLCPAYSFSADVAVCADHQDSPVWGPSTSGPFLTGTAEATPLGSYFYEPYLFDSIHPNDGATSLKINQRISVGLGDDMDLNISVPLILNRNESSTGETQTALGAGDTTAWVKRLIFSDGNTRSFLSRPALAIEAQLTVPTGNGVNLNPKLDGLDQTGEGAFQESVQILARKRAKPFSVYAQVGDTIIDPIRAPAGVAFDNSAITPTGGRIVNGDLLNYQATFEHVINDQLGLGWELEFAGETQLSHSLLFGKANAPNWSSLWVAPELEETYPNTPKFSIAWGLGVMVPVYSFNAPSSVVSMATATFNFNGPNGHRGEDESLINEDNR